MTPHGDEAANGTEERMERATQRFSAAVEEFARQVERLSQNPRNGEHGSGDEPSQEQREPRGGLLHGDDPTLAQRAEEALHISEE